MGSQARVVTFVLLAALSGIVVADTNWPKFMPTLDPGPTASPVAATLPGNLVVEAPAADVPADKARWSGRWSGWACRNYTCDTRLIVEKVSADGAVIHQALASATQQPFYARVEAKFVGDELQGTLVSGATITYRRRESGDLEFMWWKNNDNWISGILSREATTLDVSPPTLAPSYAGRWEVIAPQSGRPVSNTTSFAVKSPFKMDERGAFFVAKGTYTTYPVGNVVCGSQVDIPKELWWRPGDGAFYLTAKPTQSSCPERRFRLIRDSNGRFTWKSGSGQESVYFDPEKE